MLSILVKSQEFYDEQTQEFVYIKGQNLQLEHSLVSISKWESKWKKPFLSSDYKKTNEEVLDYIRCMTITQNVNPIIYYCLSSKNLKDINDYIDDSMTATWFNSNREKKRSREVLTSELIYFYMFSFRIPKECEKWHLNRLITLIQIFSIKNEPDKKMSKKAIMNRNRELNAQRRKSLGSKG